MDYLVSHHRNIVRRELHKLREKLPSASEDVLAKVKTENTPFSCSSLKEQDLTSQDLPTASIIWKFLLEKATSKREKFAITNELFQIQTATGPWEDASKTAEKLYEDTKLASRELQTTPLLFEAALNLGTINRLLKKLEKAEELYSEARKIAVSVKDFDKECLAQVHLAICLLDRGELKKAIDTYFEPLLASKSALTLRTRALFLQYYGNACRSAADWGRAKDYLQEALDLAKDIKDVGLESSCSGDLGNVFRSEGRYKKAEELFSTHYDYALKRGDIHGLAIACGNIGFLKFYYPNEIHNPVVYLFIEYSLSEQVGDFARMGIAFNKIGKHYTSMGHYDEAKKMFEFVIESAKRAGNVAGEGMAWGNLGTVYRALKSFPDAIDCHLKYRDNARRRMDIGGVAIMQRELAMDYFLSAKMQEAETSILDAFQTLESIRSQVGGEDESKLSNFEKNQAESYNVLQVVLVKQEKFKEAIVLADASKARVLAEIVRRQLSSSTDISSGKEKIILNKEYIAESFDNLVRVGRKLATTLVFYYIVEEFDQSSAFFKWVYTWVLRPCGSLYFTKTRLQHGLETMVELDNKFVVSLLRSLGQQSRKESNDKEATTTIHCGSGAPASLGHDITIKPLYEENNYSLQGEDNIEEENDDRGSAKVNGCTFVGTTLSILNDVVTESQSGHLKVNKNKPKSDPGLDSWVPRLSQLHSILIEPIRDFLPDKIEDQKVTFIPHDYLFKVPFAALQSDANGHYLMEDFAISTSPSIHFLDLAGASRQAIEKNTALLNRSVLAVGNPLMPSKEFPQLPYAQSEVEMIEKIVNPTMSKILTGSMARKDEVMKAMPNYKILHFATHAGFNETDSHGNFSMRGYILLAKSGQGCDGILTAEEVRRLKLNAELVVLSCCDTGLGKVTGDGILGLSRAFLAAGAACVIVTLWKIDDESASELMTSFYLEYQASRDAAVSLQKAMKSIQSKEKTRSPRHWAAFSIVGAT